MHISAWDVYWVLQLDSIGGLLVAATILSGIATCVTLFIGALMTDRDFCHSEQQDAQWLKVKRLSLQFFIATCVFAPCATLIPSTKTAAAMIVLPALVNNTSVQHEAGDLYKLAKEALAHAVQPTKSNK